MLSVSRPQAVATLTELLFVRSLGPVQRFVQFVVDSSNRRNPIHNSPFGVPVLSGTDNAVIRLMKYLRLIALLALVGCSHDAERANPVDPELTPAVTLTAAVDDTAGTVTLNWTRFAGQGFAEYQILRASAEQVTDTLAVLTDVAGTTWLDTTAQDDVSYSYCVAVVNQGGYAVPSQAQSVRQLDLPGTQIDHVDFDAASATARVTWTPYAGPRFAGYQLWRRSAMLSPHMIFETDDPAVLSFTDEALRGATQYSYQVIVVTAMQELIVSDEASGGIHLLVGSWDIDADPESHVRLQARSDGDIEALVSSTRQIRLLFYDRTGQLLETQELLKVPGGDFVGGKTTFAIEPQSVTSTLSPNGDRFLTLTPRGGDQVALLRFDASGQAISSVIAPFTEQGLPSGEQRVADLEVSLIAAGEGAAARFDEVSVTAEGILRNQHDFGAGPGEWTVSSSNRQQDPDGVNEGFRILDFTGGGLLYHGLLRLAPEIVLAAIADPTWTEALSRS